jgi:two-component system CAI-1 autoinducer sensor kinase/phosphatase CqsS
MYSLLPAFVSSLFLCYGLYIVGNRGWNRLTSSFFLVCLTSFFWQGIWAVLFQVQNPNLALILVKLGYSLILFLPTGLYHFLTEISGQTRERRYVYASYGIAACLSVVLWGSSLFVNGYYHYFFGYYPKAGLLHPLHVLQTALVVGRGLYITYRSQKQATGTCQKRLFWRLIAISVYLLAAVDYLCNYGFEFYPPGVIFITISWMIMALTGLKYDTVNPLALAGSIAHEMRTPLMSIHAQATGMIKHLPTLVEGYRLAVAHGLCHDSLRPSTVRLLSGLGESITKEVNRTNVTVDILLASIKTNQFDKKLFSHYSIQQCVQDSLENYSMHAHEKTKIQTEIQEDFQFYGSDALITLVFFNLLKNAFYAIRQAGKGTVHIRTESGHFINRLFFTDTSLGISPHVVQNIFDSFFTTKNTDGSGLGLAFCQRVMLAFGGQIKCQSVHHEYTTFILEFPMAKKDSTEHSLGLHVRPHEAKRAF